MNEDDPKSKIIPKLESEDLLADHQNESGNYSQTDIYKSYKVEVEKILEFYTPYLSKSIGSGIHGEWDFSYSNVQSNQDSERIKSLEVLQNWI